MKTVCMALFLLFGLSAFGQHDRSPRHGKEVELTPEQRATLHAKKLTLALDLSTTQQQKVQDVFLSEEEARPARKASFQGPDSTLQDPQRKYERMNQRLDAMIAHKQEMKEILTQEQYAKWEKMHSKKGHRHRHHKKQKDPRPNRRG